MTKLFPTPRNMWVLWKRGVQHRVSPLWDHHPCQAQESGSGISPATALWVPEQAQPCSRDWRVGGEWGSVCAAHKRMCSHPGGTRRAGKPTELNPGFCKPFKILSLRPLKPPASIPPAANTTAVSQSQQAAGEAAACASAQRGPRGPSVPRSWDGGPAHTAPGLRPPLPAQTCSVPWFFLGWAHEGLPLRSASNQGAVLNERLLTWQPVQVRGGQGRVHENFPPSGKTLLIEQICLLTASS